MSFVEETSKKPKRHRPSKTAKKKLQQVLPTIDECAEEFNDDDDADADKSLIAIKPPSWIEGIKSEGDIESDLVITSDKEEETIFNEDCNNVEQQSGQAQAAPNSELPIVSIIPESKLMENDEAENFGESYIENSSIDDTTSCQSLSTTMENQDEAILELLKSLPDLIEQDLENPNEDANSALDATEILDDKEDTEVAEILQETLDLQLTISSGGPETTSLMQSQLLISQHSQEQLDLINDRLEVSVSVSTRNSMPLIIIKAEDYTPPPLTTNLEEIKHNFQLLKQTVIIEPTPCTSTLTPKIEHIPLKYKYEDLMAQIDEDYAQKRKDEEEKQTKSAELKTLASQNITNVSEEYYDSLLFASLTTSQTSLYSTIANPSLSNAEKREAAYRFAHGIPMDDSAADIKTPSVFGGGSETLENQHELILDHQQPTQKSTSLSSAATSSQIVQTPSTPLQNILAEIKFWTKSKCRNGWNRFKSIPRRLSQLMIPKKEGGKKSKRSSDQPPPVNSSKKGSTSTSDKKPIVDSNKTDSKNSIFSPKFDRVKFGNTGCYKTNAKDKYEYDDLDFSSSSSDESYYAPSAVQRRTRNLEMRSKLLEERISASNNLVFSRTNSSSATTTTARSTINDFPLAPVTPVIPLPPVLPLAPVLPVVPVQHVHPVKFNSFQLESSKTKHETGSSKKKKTVSNSKASANDKKSSSDTKPAKGKKKKEVVNKVPVNHGNSTSQASGSSRGLDEKRFQLFEFTGPPENRWQVVYPPRTNVTHFR